MFAKLYFLALPIFFAIDMVWLGIISKNFYAEQIGKLMTKDINWASAIIFYLLFIVGLVVFVIAPAMEKNSWIQALTLGAFFGLVCYATYDLSNLATLKNWPVLVTIVDLIWGATISGSVSVLTFLVAKKFGI